MAQRPDANLLGIYVSCVLRVQEYVLLLPVVWKTPLSVHDTSIPPPSLYLLRSAFVACVIGFAFAYGYGLGTILWIFP
jgi:hypothetical protein